MEVPFKLYPLHLEDASLEGLEDASLEGM